MSQHSLEGFGAYRKAWEFFDLVVADAEKFPGDRKPGKLVCRQIASTDLACTNMEKGYKLAYRRFLILSPRIVSGDQGRQGRQRHRMRQGCKPVYRTGQRSRLNH